MALKTSYELHHHFPKIAEESGFTFNNHRPRVHLNWNKIRLIDVENLIRERKFVLIEQHLNDILDCVLESEFDVRILDEGVLKLFRLAQLAVEYQQFCRQYLDRSVYILRQEITTMAQELESTKKNLVEREEELRQIKRRTRRTYKTPLPYGNDNIANMILKTLSNRTELFPSTSNLDTHQYNKCKYCDKVFLNQLYLKSHIERRHTDVNELPQKETDTDPNQKFNSEIIELKKKLKDMEEIIASKSNKTVSTSSINNDTNTKDNNITEIDQNLNKQNTPKNVKDAEVSTNNDEYVINKLEEWKKEEQEKHTKEITKLRNEILETINSFKGKEEKQIKTDSESNIMEQLRATIKQQGVEISNLKEELSISKITAEKESTEKYQEAESRVAFWIQKAEAQAKQYESLLEKLNYIAKDAKESRALAEAERERATKLEAIVKQNFSENTKENIVTTESNPNTTQNSNVNIQNTVKEDSLKTHNVAFNRDTLEKLHKRAQELLNMDSISSTSTDVSSVEKFQNVSPKKLQPEKLQEKINDKHKVIQNDKIRDDEINVQLIQSLSDHQINQQPNKKELKSKHRKRKSKSLAKIEKEVKTTLLIPESPIKVVRAKLTEEVNNRLVLAGVDPLKSRLSQNVFRKQRAQLQQQHELKSKKYASFDKVRNAILTYLDENTSSVRSESNHIDEYVNSRKSSKPFRGFTSVIENVKTKALSLVKGNDMRVKEKRKSFSAEVSKKAMSLLKTPPGSTSASPQTKRSPNKMIPIIEIPKNSINKINQINKLSTNSKEDINSNVDDSEVSNGSDNKYYNTSVVQISSKSMESLLKSPARRPASASPMKDNMIKRYAITDDNETHLTRSQSARELNKNDSYSRVNSQLQKHDSSSNETVLPELNMPMKQVNSEEKVQNEKQTKGVLKNASSTSSLSKKKVLFDMDAIQMKSLSASPSQSITERSDNDHRYELGLVNLDTEEWDISSIESEPLQNDTKIHFTTRTAPKIAELKKKIESQLARRNESTTALVGSVDVLGGSLTKAPSIGGSNTSLGSSILDVSEREPVLNHKAVIKAKKVVAKNDSDLDMSELSIEDLNNKNESF